MAFRECELMRVFPATYMPMCRSLMCSMDYLFSSIPHFHAVKQLITSLELRFGELTLVELMTDSEICQHAETRGIQHYIFRLDVTVQNVVLMEL